MVSLSRVRERYNSRNEIQILSIEIQKCSFGIQKFSMELYIFYVDFLL